MRPAIRLGAVVCDAIDEPERSLAGDYGDLYSELFGAAGAEVEVVDARTTTLPDPAACRGWIIGGSRHSVDDDLPWLRRLDAWVRSALDARAPLIGICFGHQLIAHCAGGSVARAERGWSIGAVDYEVRPDAEVVPPVAGRFRLVASHRDQVILAPPAAEVFASAPSCPIAGYTIDDHVTCVQGHPEFPPHLAAALFRARVATIGAATVAAAIATLERTSSATPDTPFDVRTDDPNDAATIAGWLVERVRHAAG